MVSQNPHGAINSCQLGICQVRHLRYLKGLAAERSRMLVASTLAFDRDSFHRMDDKRSNVAMLEIAR
ncbi:hypothetical protein CCR75_001350 [Bremia lactucae]|uniref:Uncharacterized protein n=1 Tax=Bremia lactucae TaxID=4779 RepID=A0A976FFL1_BRELC|nr:hypothetical protein CCR75_001350 [Bremia lactucae]